MNETREVNLSRNDSKNKPDNRLECYSLCGQNDRRNFVDQKCTIITLWYDRYVSLYPSSILGTLWYEDIHSKLKSIYCCLRINIDPLFPHKHNYQCWRWISELIWKWLVVNLSPYSRYSQLSNDIITDISRYLLNRYSKVLCTIGYSWTWSTHSCCAGSELVIQKFKSSSWQYVIQLPFQLCSISHKSQYLDFLIRIAHHPLPYKKHTTPNS